MDPVSILKEQEKLGNDIVVSYNSLSQVAQSNIPSEEARKKVYKIRQMFKDSVGNFDRNDKELRPPSATMERNAYFTGSFVAEVKAAISNFNILYGKLTDKFRQEDELLAQKIEAQQMEKRQEDELLAQKNAGQQTEKQQESLGLGLGTNTGNTASSVPILTKESRVPQFQTGLPSLTLEKILPNPSQTCYTGKKQNDGLIRQFQYVLDDLESRLNKYKNKEVTIEILKEKFKKAESQFLEYVGEFHDDELTEIFYNLRDEYLSIPGIESYAKSLPFKLPTIDIPIFSGRITEWGTFKELFEQLIIDQPVSNTQKMCMLKAKLSGDAARKILKLPSKDENFETAWSILNEYYSDKRAVTSVYFKNILEAPFVSYNVKSVNTFLNKINESLQALEAMKLDPEEMQKAFFCFVLQRKLEDYLRIQFEQHLGKSRDLPKVDSLIDFLKQIQYSLEASQVFTKGENKVVNPLGKQSWEAGQNVVNPSGQLGNASGVGQKTSSSGNQVKIKCPLNCAVGHALYKCSKFRGLPVNQKWDKVREHKVCSKCLGYGHMQKACPHDFNCKNCNGDHHSLLHREKVPAKTAIVNCEDDDEAMLSTAIVEVKDANGQWVNCRVLLDGGATVNIISKEFRNKLNIKGCQINKEMEGLEMKKSSSDEKVGISLRSKGAKYKTFLNAVVIDKFISDVPGTTMDIKLADPKYNIPQRVDLLLSNQFVFDLIIEGKVIDKKTNTKLRNTKLGWVAYGMVTANGSKPEPSIVTTIHTTCNEVLEKFWEIEEVPRINKLTIAEKECEEHFNKNVELLKDGKFQVNLPFKSSPNLLGNSSLIAKRRFFALERKLEKNQELKIEYSDFLKKYLEMGHMEIMTNNSFLSSGYYLPHHCVLKPESTSTKLRVVFDASCKTTTNMSLNDILHTGPRIQEDLFNILVRFRKHRFVFSADIEKMYRQIWVAEADRKYQLILWRWNPNEDIKTYALKTVTYGTASAPYLAVKCLQKIADWKAKQFPKESAVIGSDFYMDDLMTGGDCLESVRSLRQNIHEIMLEFGMPLRKWCANDKALLEGINETDIENNLNIDPNNVKALGVVWNPKSDQLGLKCNWETVGKISKRTILSEVSKLFDPLGLVGPVIVTTKILLQELWKLKIDWDEKVPEEIIEKWKLIKENFHYLNEMKVPRHIVCVKPTQVELHGFCDASMKAYGAAVYVRSIDGCGNVFTHLAASKSRVAPIKVVTLPRLELCAGVLLVELMKVVVESLKMELHNIFYYSDSTIVLSCIRLDPAKLHIFVSNRVSLIQSSTDVAQWRHVKSEDNPADLISRGLLGKEILNNKFWFEGPVFLKENIVQELKYSTDTDIPELKKSSKVLLTQGSQLWWRNINHRNKFKFLQNVLAYVLKFKNLMKKGVKKPFLEYRKEALVFLIRDIQNEHFFEEKKVLKSNRGLAKTSNLMSLYPQLDKNGIIRVGGRLDKSDLPFEAKHPILLPSKDKIVELMIEELHRKHLHVGPQGLLAIVRQEFWPLRGRQLVKKIINKCYKCFRIQPREIHQLMGVLPKDRVIRTRPFLNVGIDFLGPITIHHKIRGKKTDKAYVCVFVCFSTKAAHLEAVSDLTSASFIGALKRFVSRRGCPLKIYSDNATNFVGAANSLNEVFHLFANEQHLVKLDEFCTLQNIEWINIPARSPHVGGLWEACVKSVKKHFYRVTEGTMTFEELYTLMTEIEKILNSRPLTPLSDNPNDFEVLTPGHFLIGEAFSTFIDASTNKSYHGLREHWKAVQLNTEEFWKRWSVEYLSELQKRYKWNKPHSNIKPGQLVLLKDDNTPPVCWRRGRVIRTILGSDGLCRMVDVRTSNGETKRSINNVCPFPTEETEEDLEKPSSDAQDSARKKNRLVKSVLKNNEKKDVDKPPLKAQTNITKFRNEAGIFFDEVATVGLTKTSWSITVHINISEYATAVKSLDEAMTSLGKLETKEAVYQSSAYQNLQVMYDRIINRHEMIMASAIKRQKRSLLPFVGGIYHSLFGLMDEEHTEDVVQKLKQNKINDEYLLNVVRNLSSVQDMTMEIIRKQNKAVFKDIQTLSGAISSLEEEIHETKDEAARIKMISNILMSLEVFERIQEDLIGAIFNSKGNFLNGILPMKKFKNQIELIKSNLNKNLRLPSEDTLELAKVARVSTRTTAEFVLFSIQIPLINNEIFHAYEVFQYPTSHDGFSVNIHSNNRYFLIDERKTLYYILDNDNFEHCQRMRDITICHQIHPLFSTRAVTSCEVKLFLRSKRLPDNCEIEIKKLQNYWRQTHAPNTWIFSVTEETIADVTCHGRKQHITLRGSGILTMEADCHLEAADLHLWAYDAYTSETNYVFPAMNISTFIPKINHLKLIGEMEIYKIPDIPKETKILGFPTPVEGHHLNHYGISFVTFIVIIVIVIALFWVLKKMCKMSTTYLPATVALPRLA